MFPTCCLVYVRLRAKQQVAIVEHLPKWRQLQFSVLATLLGVLLLQLVVSTIFYQVHNSTTLHMKTLTI